jgi:DNA polymerase III delta prime subunit
MDLRQNLWVFRHAPQRFSDIVLNEDIKPKLLKALDELPNMLIYGSPGIGKGCFANLIKKKENVDYMWINASDENGIEVFRNKIRPFATAMCLKDMKVCVLNECDSLTSGPQGSQKLLRQLMEDTYKICRFILICNYDGFIIPEIKSRCQVIKFEAPPKKEIGKLALNILRKEKVKVDPQALMDIVQKCYPDIRRTINVLQENTIDGVLSGSKVDSSEDVFKSILKYMLEQDIESVREELRSSYIPYPELYAYLYENAGEFQSPGGAILNIGQFLFQDTTIANKEINFMTMVVKMIYEKVI